MIVIVDYDMGNLRSVQKALERQGHDAVISDQPDQVAAATKLVLPGVGAFGDAMSALKQRGLIDPLKQSIAAGTPTLGICLGMQLLFDTSYEDGEHQGLGLVPGRVVQFELPGMKVPHMGWNSLTYGEPTPLFDGIEEGNHFYFVHSYHCEPSDPKTVAALADYGRHFCASIAAGNLYATQFHPEKSQSLGLKLLKNFAESC